uniref:Uncharacterized protein n=1 Tax=Glossina pallidipes TaxID=7398 RepID=A0A1A9ZWQ5_GLOPL
MQRQGLVRTNRFAVMRDILNLKSLRQNTPYRKSTIHNNKQQQQQQKQEQQRHQTSNVTYK